MTHKAMILYTELDQVGEMGVTQELAISELTLLNLQKATKEDEDMRQLMKIIFDGWPEERKTLTENMQDYFPFHDELSVYNGLIFKAYTAVVPQEESQPIMQKINSSHAGIQSCIRRAREVVYWPRMSSDLESFIKECQTCQESSQNQQNEPLISSEIPELPNMWQYVADDLFELKGKSCLVTVDHYSGFFEADALSTKDKTEVIKKISPLCKIWNTREVDNRQWSSVQCT